YLLPFKTDRDKPGKDSGALCQKLFIQFLRLQLLWIRNVDRDEVEMTLDTVIRSPNRRLVIGGQKDREGRAELEKLLPKKASGYRFAACHLLDKLFVEVPPLASLNSRYEAGTTEAGNIVRYAARPARHERFAG